MKYTAKFPNTSIERKFWGDFAKLPSKMQENILDAIKQLQENPRPFGTKSFKQLVPPVQFYSHVAQYRIRIGDYRVLYDVDDDRFIVWVFGIRKRSEKTYKAN